MRLRPPRIRRNAHARRVEERRVGGDEIGGAFFEPRRAPPARLADIDAEDAGLRGEAVACGVLSGQRRKTGVAFDEIRMRAAHAAKRRKSDRANAGADIDQAADAGRRRGGRQQNRVAADAMAFQGLANNQAPAEQGVVAGRKSPEPPRGSLMAQFSGEAGFLEQATRAVALRAFDHDPAGQEAERAFDGAHMLIGDEKRHALLRQQALDE